MENDTIDNAANAGAANTPPAGRQKKPAAFSLQRRELEKLSPDDQKLTIWHYEQEIEKRMEKDTTFTSPRILSEQQTKPAEANLFDRTDLAGTEVLQKAQILHQEGALLNSVSFGIGGNSLTLKVIKALQKLLYDKSRLHGQENALTGSSSVYPSALQTEHETPRTPEGTFYPTIATTPYQLCRVVMGGKRKPSNEQKAKILNELDRLEKGKFIIQEGNRAVLSSLIEVSYISDGTSTMIWIELKPLFAMIANQAYVKERADILSLLSDVSKDMTLLLYELLITAFSRGLKGRQKPYCRKKNDVFAQIAKLPSYYTNPKRREEDFKYSIGIMKRIRLLSDYSENGTTCTFVLNENHLTENIPHTDPEADINPGYTTDAPT